MKPSCRIFCLVATIGLSLSSAADAALINGSFETPALSQLGATYSTAPAGFGWTIASGDIDVVVSNYWQSSSGNQSMDLNGTTAASIYQDFMFSSAGTWAVQFDLSANPDLFAGGDGLGSGLKAVRVDFGVPGVMTHLGTYSLDSAPRTTTSMGWVPFMRPSVVVSNAVLYRLQFTSLAEGLGGPVLDNIALRRCDAVTTTLRVSEVEFCWESEPARVYQIQYRSSLTTNQWVGLFPTNVLGTGARICVPDRVPVGMSQRFYRAICLDE